MNAVFRSKVDGKFKWIAFAMPAVAVMALLTASPPNRLLWIPVGALVLAAMTVGWIFISTYYELQADELVAHCGPFTWRIPLADVTAVRESKSTRSGPALSMDRLEIVHGPGRVLIISPADKERFLAALRRRAPALS
jgi:hypothetical protein